MPKRSSPFASATGCFASGPSCDGDPAIVRLSLRDVSVLLPRNIVDTFIDCNVTLTWMVAEEYDLDTMHTNNSDALIQGVVFRSGDTHTFFSAGGIIASIPVADVPVGTSAWLYIAKSTDTRARTRASVARR